MTDVEAVWYRHLGKLNGEVTYKMCELPGQYPSKLICSRGCKFTSDCEVDCMHVCSRIERRQMAYAMRR